MAKRKKHFSEEFKQDSVNYYYSSSRFMKAATDDLKISRLALTTGFKVQDLMKVLWNIEV